MRHLTRFQISIFASSILIATLACSLGPRAAPNPQPSVPQPTAFIPPAPTNTPTPQANESNSASNQNTSNTSGSNNAGNSNVVVCNPRTDWYVYRVVSGDTLAAIARRVNSSVNVLAAANCLANANTIRVGQALYVPQLPIPTNTPIPPSPIPGRAGYVSLSPALFGSNNSYYLQANSTVTATYSELPAGTVRVDFYVTFYNQNPSVMGSDSHFADGVNIVWVVPGNSGGVIEARAIRPDGSIVQRSYETGFATTIPIPPNTCVLQAVTNAAVNIYHEPVANAKWGDLLPGQWMLAVGRTSDGWIALLPSAVLSHSTSIYDMVWVAESNQVAFQGPCANLATIRINLASTGCFVSGSPNLAIPIYDRPYENSQPIGTLDAGTSYEVMGQTSTGWYGIKISSPNIAPSGYGTYGLRWIKNTISLPPSPQCSGLPTIY